MKELSSTGNLYIQLLQENISRMNQNCMQCKTWCVALVTGILTVVATTQKTDLLFIGMAITLGAYLLDASYLRLEKNFRCFEKRLVDELKKGNEADDKSIEKYLFDFEKDKLETKRTRFLSRKDYQGTPNVPANRLHWRDAFFSWSTLPVYVGIEGILIVAYLLIPPAIMQCCCHCC